MAVLQTYADGNRLEDVMRMVVTITPTDTPFMSGIQKKKAANTLHQWPTETLTTRQDNAVVEGATFSYGTRTAPGREINVTQIFDKTFSVSSTEGWVKGAGVDDMALHQKQKAIKEISTDVEHALLRGSRATGNASVARRLAGALNWVTTCATAVVSGTKLTESFYCGLLELAWAQGGKPDETYTASMMKRVISSFTAGLTRNITADDKRLVNSVDVYESDFGIQKILLSRDILSGAQACAVLVIENAKWAMAVGEPIAELPLAKVAQTLHGDNGVIRGELTLECLAEPANAKATGLENSF